jgi:CBS domain containing-hemolysin-like protein
MNQPVLIFASLFLITLFSGLDTAYCATSKLSLEIGDKANPFFFWLIRKLTGNSSIFFTTLAAGFIISLVGFSFTTTHFIETVILKSISGSYMRLVIEIFAISLLGVLCGLFIPKIFFRITPYKILILFSLPLGLLFIILFPIVKILNLIFLTNFSKNRHSVNTRKDNIFLHSDFLELDEEAKVNQSNVEYNVEKEVLLIRNTLDFSKVKLREILVPRNEIALLDINSDIEILKKKFIETGFSRILFFEDNKDNIVGYVHSSAIFQKAKQIKPFLKDVLIVPETMAANRLLSRFIREHRSIALVVDEFGGTAGLVTTEDILEEIFGEIEDEHDVNAIFEKKLNERQFIFSGRYEIDALNEKYKWNIPESDHYETLAGFVLYHFESIPKVNEIIKIGSWSIQILKATTTKIELVKLTLNDNR